MEFTKYSGDRNPVTIAVVGAGLRGRQYARLAAAQHAEIVAVAEPDPERRAAFARTHGIPAGGVFDSWEAMVAAGRLADAVVVATQDRLHVEPAVALARQRYHLLLEKPMAPTEPEARRIAEAVEAAGVIGAVCHVLRYTPYTKALKATMGSIGDLVSVQHLEPVGWWHQAHSFVRGNWRREDESGPMLLTKSCHDLDWLAYVVGSTPSQVASFGGLAHFHAGKRPHKAAARCVDCAVEPTCPYSAVRLYKTEDGRLRWPVDAVTDDPRELGRALRTGPYGRCVYDCDNDVVDHQVVAMQYSGGVTATFTMTAFTPMQRRQTRLFGSHGSIEGDGRHLTVTDFRTGTTSTVDTGEHEDGHDGGDEGLVAAFVAAVAAGDPTKLSSDMATSLASHRVVWSAERARLTSTVVRL
ncbi:Gfo/Idh/MocA family oxidoreductase [Dactylosporangium sp. NPDC050588]|uniref:Gfo/Idh/MocA family protein n=1 Tax=Dactylosporangium sp. NPDC050588 TaxID=3157211 RepID=UPI0033D988AD